ncbi:PhoH-like phosphate starvation-inducible [Sinorhizobium phage phiM9]|uniref:Putative phosphate-starvation-inducible protein n=1 Tax=Sinorhizobium phage phiM9 TaxID=1636182 RepID=A0A0F6R5V7_9CAUD|nr:PhoH-like phosphate starvation-inducible [Sinorhizobium phage phiM9]AKE44715.1 putative phosphate-starvation-inducible protein [Sinorhizobium phage phiM9]
MSKKPTTSAPAASTPLQRFISSTAAHHTRPQHDKIVISARNLTQKHYIKSLQSNNTTVGVGPAGCGKTYLPTLMAIDDLINERMSKIMIIRPSVPVDGENDIGALPGDILGKFGPQVKPVTDTIAEYIGLSKMTQLIMNEVIEIVPVAFIRGRSPKNTWLLVDEAQNLSKTAMKAILTRPGENCKMAICGDIEQSDRPSNNGLEDLLQRLRDRGPVEGFGLTEFTEADVVRSEHVRNVLSLYAA